MRLFLVEHSDFLLYKPKDQYLKQTLFQFFRYNLAGIVNTVVGFSIIFMMMFLGVGATLSNAIGYAVGSVLSYVLNFFTLQCLLSFADPYLAQLGAAMVYTLSSFILAKFFVFKEEK